MVLKYNKTLPYHYAKKDNIKLGYARSFYNSLFKYVLTQRQNSMYRKLNTLFLVTFKKPLKTINRVKV